MKTNFILFPFTILILSLIFVVIVTRIKTSISINNTEWKEYKNNNCTYQLSYPANWPLKDSQYQNPCDDNKNAKCITNQSLFIQNKTNDALFKLKKKLFNKPPGDIGPPNRTTFFLYCSSNNNQYSSIEDWVRKSWLSSNDDIAREKKALGRIRKMKFGNTALSVFVAYDDKMLQAQNQKSHDYVTHSRLHFIYKNRIYEIHGRSGSFEQLKKDNKILDKMLRSFELF